MRRLLMTAALLLAASPAYALTVTNLDTVPHTINFETLGTVHREVLAPGRTVDFYNLPNGRLSLVDSAHPRTGGRVNADGILSGYIGNGRDQNIPVDQMDEYVIWPGGDLQLQRRMKRYGHHF